MSLYVLDTDMLTLLEEAHPVVAEKVRTCAPESLAVTVVTVEEKLTGWYTLIRRAKKPEQFIHAYHRLAGAVDLLKPLRILEVSQTAFDRYQDLKAQKLGVRKMDLLIAAIVESAVGKKEPPLVSGPLRAPTDELSEKAQADHTLYAGR